MKYNGSKRIQFLVAGCLILFLSCETTQEPVKEKVVTLPGDVALEMVYIPPGSFLMGSPEDEIERHGDEGPVREVTITKGFYLGKYEITQAQWTAIMVENPSVFRFFGDSDQHPVDMISWDDCQKYTEELNKLGLGTFRLPTEAEWEYACRAGTNSRYYWGVDSTDWKVHQYAWAFSRAEGRSHPVGMKQPNAWGLYDMSGNVWEWCLDWRSSKYEADETADPKGNETGKKKVYRGGSWFNKPATLRSANRNGHETNSRGPNSGLRLLMEVE